MNPVRAGLVCNPEDWPHVLSFDGRDGSPSRPQRNGAGPQGRDGSPNRPPSDRDGSVGTDVPAVRAHNQNSGRLGEASLPKASPPDAEARP
jgi:hypothetical protein